MLLTTTSIYFVLAIHPQAIDAGVRVNNWGYRIWLSIVIVFGVLMLWFLTFVIFSSSFVSIEFKYVSRNSNGLAHHLAKIDSKVLWWPCLVWSFIRVVDEVGMPFSHAVFCCVLFFYYSMKSYFYQNIYMAVTNSTYISFALWYVYACKRELDIFN